MKQKIHNTYKIPNNIQGVPKKERHFKDTCKI